MLHKKLWLNLLTFLCLKLLDSSISYGMNFIPLLVQYKDLSNKFLYKQVYYPYSYKLFKFFQNLHEYVTTDNYKSQEKIMR